MTAFRLTVATFNRRAVHLYEKLGFEPVRTFISEGRAGRVEFLLMTRPARP
jgi:ribosomal protein S18 acetylase RimI-like enzyme